MSSLSPAMLLLSIPLAFVLITHGSSFRFDAASLSAPKHFHVSSDRVIRRITVRQRAYDSSYGKIGRVQERRQQATMLVGSGGTGGEGDDGVDYSADRLTQFLGKFLPSGGGDADGQNAPPKAKDLVFNAGPEAKRRGLSPTEMAAAVDDGLRQNGWFVTGKMDASLFSDIFFFKDPNVSLTGVDKYAEGVAKLFDQEESRCDVISSEADGEQIVVKWRLAGRINLPFKPPIKPYVVTTTFERDEDGLLSTQEDEFAIAGWDILLHAVFPGHPFGAEPAPPVPPRA